MALYCYDYHSDIQQQWPSSYWNDYYYCYYYEKKSHGLSLKLYSMYQLEIKTWMLARTIIIDSIHWFLMKLSGSKRGNFWCSCEFPGPWAVGRYTYFALQSSSTRGIVLSLIAGQYDKS